MSDALNFLHQGFRLSHIGLGFLGLTAFWIPIFAKKGGPLHIRAGWLFALCALYVGTTGLVSSIWALVHPLSFAGIADKQLSTVAVAEATANLRFFFSILGILSLAVISGVIFGLQVVRRRADHERLRNPLLQGTLSALGVGSLAMAGYGFWNLLLVWNGSHPSTQEFRPYYIHVVLGLLFLLGALLDLSYVLRPRATRMAWWYKHMECMLGAGIAFHTAFLVFGVNRLFAFRLPGAWALLPWVLPSLVGLPATTLWTRYYRRKFHELTPLVEPVPHASEVP